MTTNFLDVVWLTFCGVLVFIMQAGFLCLEAGSTRSKNRINIAVKNFTDLSISVLIFWAAGYGLMFGNSWQGVIGIDQFAPNLGENKDIWTGSFFLFQAMFCSTAVTILSGAAAERLKFKGYLAIAALISGIIYPVAGHWTWQGLDTGLHGGWLANKGFVDFAGSTVVHSVGGWCSLAAVLVIGPRLGRFSSKRQFDDMASTDIPIAFLGTMLLWFGWFGFNGGSNLVFDAQVSNIIANTLMAGTAGGITPIMVSVAQRQPIDIKPVMNGVIAALVAVTSGCHAFSTTNSLIVGGVGSLLMTLASHGLEKWEIDDVVGAIPVHLVAGIWGTLATGLLGNLDTLNTGLNRLNQVKVQTEGILAYGLWAFGLTLGCLLIFEQFSWLRVSARHEYIGLNISEHGAKSQADDVYSVMYHHAKTGDLCRRVNSDSFTEAGRIGHWYNQVIEALEMAVTTNKAIINTAVDGILTIHKTDLTIRSANPSTGKLFGYDTTELLGQPLQQLLTHELTPTQLLQIAQAATPHAMQGNHRNGLSFPIEVLATEASACGQSFFTVFLKDISARKLAEETLLDSRAKEQAKATALEDAMLQLRRTQAQLIQKERIAGQGQLVAGIAHEINNPVSFIYGNLEYAQDYVQDLLSALNHYQQHHHQLPEATRSDIQTHLQDLDISYITTDFPKLLTSMQTGAERIESIVKQLRTFSRYDESELKSVNLHDGLDSSLMVLAHRLEPTPHRPAINIIRKYGQLPIVECYASALNRAILNLVTNAIDAFDRAAQQAITQELNNIQTPQITLQTLTKGGQVTLVIGNNGPHIPEAVQKKLFDPFFTTQPVGQGVGLGCTISYQIVVEQHHGQLICQSVPGNDTCFTIELPVTQAPVRLRKHRDSVEIASYAPHPTSINPLPQESSQA